MKLETTTCIILDTRRKRKDSLYPVKLRVTHNRYSKYYALGYALSQTEFEKVMGKAPRKGLKTIKKYLFEKEETAIDIIETLKSFNFCEFETMFLQKKVKNDDVFIMLSQKIEKLFAHERIKTAQSYECTLSSFKSFAKKKSLPVDRITVQFLQDYESWMIKKGNSITTVGIYCRILRTIFNEAIAEGIIKYEMYPFGRRKYEIPKGNGKKKALTKDDVLKIIQYHPKNKSEDFSRDMWVFSYLSNGMNFTDIANLKAENIDDGFLTFIRSKTKGSTRSNPILIKVFLMEKLKEIIKKWGNQLYTDNDYLFPILSLSMSAKEKVHKIYLTIQSVNHHIGNVAKSIGINIKVTTYTARHSYATVMKRSGASIEFISESLGHQSTSTTRNYLDSFEDEEKIKWSGKLL